MALGNSAHLLTHRTVNPQSGGGNCSGGQREEPSRTGPGRGVAVRESGLRAGGRGQFWEDHDL